MNVKKPTQKQQQTKQQPHPDKFDLKPGDLKFFNTNEELEQYLKKKFPDRKFVD